MKSILFFIVITTSVLSFAQNKTTISDGSWFDPAIWSPSGVPLMEDTVFINHDVTVTGNYVDFGANWLIVNPAASIVGDTIFSLHGNLKMKGLMDLTIIAVGDGDSTQVYGTIQGRKYIPGNPNNFNYTGQILSDSLILGDNFQNFSNVDVLTLVVGGPMMINRNGAQLKVTGSAIFGGPVENEPNGLMDIYSLLTSENFLNNGLVYCFDWTHAQSNVSGTTGKFCIENCFMNVSNISGTVDICDASPGGFCDVNMGTIAATVTNCVSGPCPVIGLSENGSKDFSMIPNPAVSSFEIILPNPGMVVIHNSIGKEVARMYIQNSQTITLEELQDGMYFVTYEGVTKKLLRTK
ncbi:MAG: T9SS type A sorting domain-containing protein [Bacteroidetes bacterium]|nr:MAG: T9SS type A sorting domain-containing protein [Bacteroidota bacterium]